jgi:class 3 adenylate cyclase
MPQGDQRDRPETQYARSADGTNIAFNVTGSGSVDLVMVPGWTSHLEMDTELLGPFFRRLSSFSRLICFDKRGTGLSDRVDRAALPTLDDRMADLDAVMRAAGTERPALLGISEGGPMCVLFAASHPERVRSLILYGSHAVAALPDDTESFHARLAADPEGFSREIEARWGEGVDLDYFVPGLGADPEARRIYAKRQRAAASPAAAAALIRMSYDSDVSAILPTLRVPTLVLHRRDERAVGVAHGRYLAQHIPDAEYVELDGDSHMPQFGDWKAIVDEIEQFITGQVKSPISTDRVLATILFTDIVESTRQAAAVGDAQWIDVLDAHDRMVRRLLERWRGREIKTTGDGFLASFDAPARAVRCAAAIVDGAQSLGLSVRAGVHTGEVERRGDDISGMGVHIGARVAALAVGDEVLVSYAVPPLVAGSGIEFEDRGEHELKGVPGHWRLYVVLA